MFYVYFIKSKIDSSVYVGSTTDLRKRFKEHNQGKTRSIKSKTPFELIYYEAYLTKTIARKRELQLKNNWSEKEKILKRIK